MADAKTFFETTLPQKISNDPAKAKMVGAVYLFVIDGDGGGTWTVDLKNEPGVKSGDAGGAECTLKLDVESWNALQTNPQSGMQLYFQGKLKVTGNAMLATKLQQILGA